MSPELGIIAVTAITGFAQSALSLKTLPGSSSRAAAPAIDPVETERQDRAKLDSVAKKPPRTHLIRELNYVQGVHVTWCGMYSTIQRQLIFTVDPTLVDCSRCVKKQGALG